MYNGKRMPSFPIHLQFSFTHIDGVHSVAHTQSHHHTLEVGVEKSNRDSAFQCSQITNNSMNWECILLLKYRVFIKGNVFGSLPYQISIEVESGWKMSFIYLIARRIITKYSSKFIGKRNFHKFKSIGYVDANAQHYFEYCELKKIFFCLDTTTIHDTITTKILFSYQKLNGISHAPKTFLPQQMTHRAASKSMYMCVCMCSI